MRQGIFIAGIFFAALMLMPDAFASSVRDVNPLWKVEYVMNGTTTDPEIAVDSLGRPHLAINPWFENVHYAFRDNNTWTLERLPFTNGLVDIDIDSNDNPHISDLTNYTAAGYFIGSRINGTWSYASALFALNMKIDSKGQPHILSARLFSSNASTNVYIFQYAYLSNGTWIKEDIPGATYGSRVGWADFALGPDDSPHLLYWTVTTFWGGDVVYGHRTPTGWQLEAIEKNVSEPWAWKHGSLAIARDGTLHAAYYVTKGVSPNYTRHLRHAVRDANGWQIESIGSSFGYGFNPTMMVSKSGLPRIGFVGVSNETAVFNFSNRTYNVTYFTINYAVHNGKSWNIEKVLNFISPSGLNPTEFALDDSDTPHVVFNEFDNYVANERIVSYAARILMPQQQDFSVKLRVEPRTLNLKSRGKWVNAQIFMEGITADKVDLMSLELNGVPVARAQIQDDNKIHAKFDREKIIETLNIGKEVTVILTGKLKSGEAFTATDIIRVIRSGN